MADSTLVNRYRQYKAGTTKLVNSLAYTARSCEDVTAIVPSLRAAKDSAKQAKRKQKNSTAPLDTTVTLTTSQLISLAQVVVKAAVMIPEDIIQTTKTVIAGRQMLRDTSKIKHQHFITVLGEVLQLLETSPGFEASKAFRPSKQGRTDTSVKHGKEDDSMSNMFSYLNIYDPLDNAPDSPPVSTQPASCPPASKTKAFKPPVSKVDFELEESDGDRSFAVWCLLHDLLELRLEVRTQWVKYRNGEVSFSAVAELTANAIVMMQYAESEFVLQYPDMCAYDDILDHLNLDIHAMGPNVWVCPRDSNDVADVSNGRVCGNSVAELICPRANIIFQEFTKALAKKLGKRSRNTKGDQSAYLEIHPFGEALLALLPHLEDYILRKLQRVQEDPLLSAARLVAARHGVAPNTWMIMTCQTQMDLHEVMGSNFKSGIRDYQSRLSADLASLQSFSSAAPDFFGGSYSDHHLIKICKKIMQQLREYIKDPLHDYGNQSANAATTTASVFPEYRLYNVFPIVPGLLMNDSAIRVHSFGISACHYQCLVLSMAYLYKTALNAGAVQTQWADMNFVIDSQSKQRPFVLESDVGMGSMAKRFGLALGVKLQQYAKGRHAHLPNPEYVKQNGRHLENWPVLNGSTSYKFFKDSVSGNRGGPKLDLAIRGLDQLGNIPLKDTNLEAVYQQYKSNGRVTLVQLLFTTEKIYALDEMDLKFDSIGFYLKCEKMLQEILRSCGSALSALHKRQPFNRGTAYEIVYAILCDAAKPCKHPPTSSELSIVQQAGAVMEQYITTDGSCYSKLAREQTSGHLPQRPTKSSSEPKQDMSYTIEMLRALGLWMEESEVSGGKFYNSRELSEARIAAHKHVVRLVQNPLDCDIKAVNEALVQFMELNSAEMTDEERASADERYERVCRNLGASLTTEELKKMIKNAVRSTSGNEQ